MDSKNLAIGVLSTTAVILLVGLILVQNQPQPALAVGMNAQGGDYLLTTGQLSSSRELLYVIDAAQEKMLVYGFDINKQKIEVVSQPVDLAKMRSKTGGEDDEDSPDTSAPAQRRGRGRG